MNITREIERFDPSVPLEAASTPPASWYVRPELFDLERDRVFRRSWQPVTRHAGLTEPGAFASGRFGDLPWVVVRGNDGELRGFHNVCRHKGREVVTGTGRAATLVCGYHSWAYDLCGLLRVAPRISGIADFDRASVGLPPLRVECWGPWAFVNADLEARPLAERLEVLSARLDPAGWSRLAHAGSRSWTLQCNWKVFVDNYLDGGYHVPYMHPTLDAQIDMASYRTEVLGELSIQSATARTAPDGRIDYPAAERIGERAIYAWIHPNFMVNRYGPFLDSNHVVPLGPDRCRVDFEFFVDPAAGGEGPLDARPWVRDSIRQAELTQDEDREICESVQVGLRSGAYDRGRYAPRLELGEHHFHCLLHRDLAGGAPRRNGDRQDP